MSRVVGFTRPRTRGGSPATEEKLLRDAGASEIFVEPELHGTSPVLTDCLQGLQTGDVLVVTQTSCLSLGPTRFIALHAALIARGIQFRSLLEPILSSGSDATANDVVVGLDALRRELASLRTREGMERAASEGRRPGRPVVMTEDMTAMAIELRRLDRSYAQIARVLEVSTSAVRRAVLEIQNVDHK